MSQKYRMSLLALLLAVPFAVPVAMADNELVPSTEVTASYDVWGWMKSLWQKEQTPPHVTEALASLPEEALAAIEPASGGAAKADEGHGGGDAKAEVGGHGEPAAHGKTEGKKSFSGKVLTTAPALPTVTIGGQTIMTKAQVTAEDRSATIPAGLVKGGMQDFLERRFSVTPYAHSPYRGDPYAKISVIQFVDLSCGQCLPELAKIDAVLQDSSASVVLTSIHAPTARFQDTNMPAFYGKIADRAGLFWTYRANLIQDKPVDANAFFNELIKSGMSVRDARSLMLTDARRFYRELDADSLLARSLGISRPPVLFINGIRVGENGIPLEKLPDVMDYVNARIARGLPEPPTK